MALKQVVIGAKIADEEKRAAAAELRVSAAVEKINSMAKREAELEAAVSEMNDETTQEERDIIDQKVTEFEADAEAAKAEQTAAEEERDGIAAKIAEYRAQLAELNKIPEPTKKEERAVPIITTTENRGSNSPVDMIQRQEVKDFLQRFRDMKKQGRSITGAEFGVPVVMLDVIRQNIMEYSKLYSLVRRRMVGGKARQNIVGTPPKAVWTEMTGAINEVDMVFYQVEIDGYKVAGYAPIPNSTLDDAEDNLNLYNEIVMQLGQSIGMSLDDAIIFGTGAKMPLGFVTRLAQTAKPSDYSANDRPWVNLSTTNITTISAANSEGIKLFQNIAKASGAAKGRYSRGGKFWVCNETTKTTLLAAAMAVNAAGAIVSGMNETMPVIGGTIKVIDSLADNAIYGGYGDLYLLSERAGTTIKSSEHVRFLEDQTVFKATARYDGRSAIAEGFVAIGIGGVAPPTTTTFASDAANTPPTEGSGA